MNQVGDHKKKFHAYENAIAIARAIRPLLDRIGEHDPKLADEAKRATQSTVLNTCEGNMRTGKDRLHAFKIALGSAREIVGTLDMSEVWGYLTADQTKDVRVLLDKEAAMLWRLGRPKKI